MKSKLNSLSLRSIGEVVSRSSRRRIYGFAVARALASFLDILGLAGIALLATSFGAFATSGGSVASIDVPVRGEIIINATSAVVIALLIVCTFLLKSAFSIFLTLKTGLFVADLEAGFSKTLAQDYFSGGSEGERGFTDSLSEFQNISMASAIALSSFINSRIAAISEVALLIGMIGAFLLINPVAAVAMFVYLGSVLWALSQFVTKRIRTNGVNAMMGSRIALTSSRDLFGVRREVRASGVLNPWVSKFTSGRSQSASSDAIIMTLSGLPRFVIETSLILGIFAFLAGIIIFSDLPSQAVTIGVFMAGGLRVVASLLPLQSAINTMINGANQGKFALERLTVIANRESSVSEGAEYSHDGQALGLELQGVSFGFTADQLVVHNISFSVAPGQKVALVGPSGAGKTTSFELATGFRLPQAGKITVGGISPREHLENGNGAIGIVPQRPHLVSGTLAENVSLAPFEQTDFAQALKCLELAGLKSFADEDSLRIEVHPDSGQLSGGEMQRLGLARALYRNPGILFLDEATSALDAETESEINKVLDELRGRMTIVLIAHRLSTVKNADKIIYLDNRKVVAEGTFAELQKEVPDFKNAVKLMGLQE